MKGSKGKFTLIELLVVVAIIGILASLLLPSLQKARLEAESAVCKSNERQVGVGVYLFADTNDHKVNTGRQAYNGSNDVMWHSVLLQVLDAPRELMNCPTAYKSFDNVISSYSQSSGRSDYGWNWTGYSTDSTKFGLGWKSKGPNFFDFRGGNAFMSSITDPDNMITFGDRGEYWNIMSALGHTGFPIDKVMPFIHKQGQGGNIYFLDGHVSYMKATSLFSPDTKSMWSRDND